MYKITDIKIKVEIIRRNFAPLFSDPLLYPTFSVVIIVIAFHPLTPFTSLQ